MNLFDIADVLVYNSHIFAAKPLLSESIMKKLIPILSIIIAAAALVIAGIGLVVVSVAVSAKSLGLIAVPFILVGAVVSAFSAAITAMFRRDILCRIAFFIDLGAFVLSVVSVILWQCAL